MWADVVVNFPVQNQGVVHVIRRPTRIEVEHSVRIMACVLKKILGSHCSFTQRFVTLVEYINQHGFFTKLRADISSDLESGTCERVYRDDFAFVKPKPNRGIELTLNRVWARYLGHFSTMSAMTSLFCAVLPLRFPFQNLRARDRHYFRRKLFETFERCFLFGRLGAFHETHYRISWSLVQFLPSESAPSDRCNNENQQNLVARMPKHRTPRS